MHSTPSRRRSIFVTLIAWVTIVVAGLLIPISFISLLMILVKSHGTANTTLLGFFSVVMVPPLALISGIGLLLRKRWGLYGVIAVLSFIILMQGWELMTARSQDTTYTSPSGVKTTVMASGPNYHSVPIMAVCGLAIIWLLRPSLRAEFGAAGKMIAPPIPPTHPVQAAPTPVATPPPLRAGATPAPAKQRLALVCFVAGLLGITLVMGWLVIGGISSGETYFPAKRSSQQRSVIRSEEPGTFWMSIIVYSAIGLGSAGFALWMVVVATRGNTNRAMPERPY